LLCVGHYLPLLLLNPKPTAATPAAAAAEELQELLLAWEEPTWREEVLATGEKKARILEKAIAKVTTDLNTDQAKVVAT
jgi:hypothetical protein